MKFYKICLAVFAVALLFSTSIASARKADDTLEVAFPRNVTTLDGLYSTRRENDILGLLTDDALFYVDQEQMKAIPLVAKTYKFSVDNVLDIELRQDVFFHDGSHLTAEDVVYSLNWTLNPKGKTRYQKRLDRWITKVEAKDKFNIRIFMKFPYALALYELSYYSKIRKKGYYNLPDNVNGLTLNGTGPYRVVNFEPAKKLILERFDKYRENSPKGMPSIKNISIRTIPDWGTQAAEILSGGIQWTFNMPTDLARDLGNSPRAKLKSGISMRIGFLNMDAKGVSKEDTPLTKLKVRQAINHAIDRKSFVEYLIKGTAKVIDSACHPIQFGCTQDVQKYEFNPILAKKLLLEAGYPDGFELELWSSRDRSIMEMIVDNLGKVGIRTKLRFVKSSALGKARRANTLSFYFGSWGSYSIPDASAIATDHWFLNSNRNLSGDKVVETLIEAANSTNIKVDRIINFDKAFQRIAENAYWVPLYSFTMNYVMTPDVDFTPSKDGMQRLFLIKWKQ